MKKPINEKAPVKARNQIEINAPINSVWNILTEIDNWANWQKAVTKTVVNGEIIEGTTFDWKAGGLSFKSQIHTSEPTTRFGWTGKTIGTSAIHNWIFEDKGKSTLVTVEESLDGFLPKLFKNFFQKTLDEGILKSLEELKSISEKK